MSCERSFEDLEEAEKLRDVALAILLSCHVNIEQMEKFLEILGDRTQMKMFQDIDTDIEQDLEYGMQRSA